MTRWNNHLKTVVLLGALSALLIGIGNVLAPGYLGVFAVLALAMNVGAYFFSDRMVLRMHGAQEVDPARGAAAARHGPRARRPRRAPDAARLPDRRSAAERLRHRSRPGARRRRRDQRHPRACCRPASSAASSPTSSPTSGIATSWSSTIAACVTGVITYAAHAVGFFGMGGQSDEDGEHGSPFAGILMALVAPLAATLIQLGISRSREYLADETGAEISGDPLALASALARLEQAAAVVPSMAAQPATASLFIVNPFAGGARMARLFSTHPATADRIARLEAIARPR